MPDATEITHGSFQGIPITAPLADAWQAHEALTNMTIAYPGEMFTIESPMGDDDRAMVVTWIPQFYMNQFLRQIIATRVGAATYWAW
jgi:hypothetical protein